MEVEFVRIDFVGWKEYYMMKEKSWDWMMNEKRRKKEEMPVSRNRILFQNHMQPNEISIVSPLSIR